MLLKESQMFFEFQILIVFTRNQTEFTVAKNTFPQRSKKIKNDYICYTSPRLETSNIILYLNYS
jgi:hypothetical protein